MVETIADMHRALGDETRVRMVHLLLHRGELAVGDVEKILETTQSKASRHMNHLKVAGIVEDRREGTWVYYRVRLRAHEALRAALKEIQRGLAADEAAQADLERAAALGKKGELAPPPGAVEKKRARRRGT